MIGGLQAHRNIAPSLIALRNGAGGVIKAITLFLLVHYTLALCSPQPAIPICIRPLTRLALNLALEERIFCFRK